MVPRTITRGLASLRMRERLVQLAWGGALLFAVVVVMLLLGGFVDWLVDRDQETPDALRFLIAGAQGLVALAIIVVFLALPLARRLPDDELALRVEDQYPVLDERLISAVQFNQEGADTEGMSPVLIAHVTREAEKEAARISFTRVADHGRLAWAAALALPALALAALPFLLAPDLASTLLARQFLSSREIPRLYSLEPLTAEVFPQGEKVRLRFKVKGPNLGGDLLGEVRVQPKDQPQDRYELTPDSAVSSKDGEAIYFAQLPAGSTDFKYRARLADGRSREGTVKFVALPVVSRQWAWVQLPAFCGLRPSGQPYEQSQSLGDIAGIQGSSGRVRVQIQKPVRQVILHLGKRSTSEEPIQEKVDRHLNMVSKTVPRRELEANPEALAEALQEQMVEVYEATFDLREQENYYEIEAVDEYGFVNKPRPRRSVRLILEEPPQVSLLKEQFPPGFIKGLLEDEGASGLFDDAVVEGMPVLLGQKVRIPYQCHGPYGLGTARILYRLLKKTESGNDPVKETPWTMLPLGEVRAGPGTGAFVLQLGAFENSPFLESIPFHAIPSDFPESKMGRTLGGGRYDLATTGLVDHQGKPLSLNIGDQIEYCVEVFADKNADPKRPSARSETRVKTVVSLSELDVWIRETIREEQAIRTLDKKQRGIFDK